jgi:putative ABC transport system permease protein
MDVNQIRDMMDDMIDSLNSVVWVIISVAALLAMVVLYNLTNINITERERELATLKVLGFYRSEVSSYIFREGLVLTLIGVAFGLVGGIFLHRYVVESVAVNEVMFGMSVFPKSYVFAGLFTVLCAFAVNAAMRPKILRIDPADSLKSME